MRLKIFAGCAFLGLGIGVGCSVLPFGPIVTDTSAGLSTVEPFNSFLKVARHDEQSFSSVRLDTIFLSATRALNIVNDDCNDVFCPVTFLRDGPIETFSIGSPIVTTEAQLDDIFDEAGDIKIVRAMVGVCGQAIPDDMTVVLGCAFTGGSAVLVQNAPADVWAHEWGHVQGLPHRDSCARNLMHAFELQTNAVNETERDAFLSDTPSRSFFRVQPPDRSRTASAHLARDGDEPLAAWLDRLTTGAYLAGLPIDVLAAEDPDAVRQVLEERLARAEPAEQCNLFRCLGFTGQSDTCGVLIDRLTALRGMLGDAQVAAGAEALLALGRLAAADPTEAALRFLVVRTDPSAWADQDLALTEAGSHDLTQDLARLAVMALGAADHPAAVAHLEAMAAAFELDPPVDPWMPAQVSEALARHHGDWQRLRAGDRLLRQP